jgi:trans-aconitate 2-methyltransferase
MPATVDTWNPAQYEKFQDERTAPFFDLMALLQLRPAMRVADLGCGTGELTRLLHQHLQARETVGIDSSEAMLAKSTSFAGDGLRFEQGDIATFADSQGYDLIFSNAAIHWVPVHEALLGRLASSLREGGQLAIQAPANHDYPSHTVAEEVAAEQPFREALGGHVRRSPVLTPEQYAAVLHRLGFREQHIRLQVYVHYLPSRDGVVEWVKGSLLTYYQSRLPADLFDRFVQRYRERLLPRLEDAAPFFYPFKRILFWAQR